jgi:carbon-monoxide dehydrogenase medium subunit
MNTRILDKEFDYTAPVSLAEALSLLGSEKDIKILAGGTDLIVKIKTGVDIPMKIMLDIQHIAELDGVTESKDGSLHIGAATKLSFLEKHPAVITKYSALEDAIKAMASIAVRNMATIGGNLANASPAADTAGPCLVYEAAIKLASDKGERFVPINEFFSGAGKTVMNHNEMITEIILPAPSHNYGSAFIKKTRVKPDIAKISVSVLIQRDGDKISLCRLAMGSIADSPVIFPEIAARITGEKAEQTTFSNVAKEMAQSIVPITDNRSTAEYRKQITEFIAAETLAIAWQRTGGSL